MSLQESESLSLTRGVAWIGKRPWAISVCLAIVFCSFALWHVTFPHLKASYFCLGTFRYWFDPLWLQPTPARWLQIASMVLLDVSLIIACLIALRWVRSTGRRRFAPGLLYTTSCLVTATLAAEVMLQCLVVVVGPERASADGAFQTLLARYEAHPSRDGSPYFWTLLPGEPTLSGSRNIANSFGLRERELPLRKAPGEIRVLCVGDSWTFGSGVRQEQAWPRRLEFDLQNRMGMRRVTVINAGQGGMGYLQGYLMITQIGLAYDPDIVVTGGLHSGPPQPDFDGYEYLSDIQTAVRAVERQSVLYTSLRALGRFTTPQVESADYARKIARILDERGIRGLHFHHMDPGPGPALLKAALEGYRASQVVSSLPYEGWQQDQARFLLVDSNGRHPSPEGHEEIARMVANSLEAQGWLPATTTPDSRPPTGPAASTSSPSPGPADGGLRSPSPAALPHPGERQGRDQ